ncbi:MAG: DUF692 domain-containing protein [Proteobacteria bacterium]|nr:MAG: DUF692 domain-containing protein [Pseudomonadota bacterium]
MNNVIENKSFLGFGLGLRTDHYDDVLNRQPAVDWFEVITENYLVPGGRPLDYLHRIRERYPMVMHGVSMSVGSTDPIDLDYVANVKRLADDLDVPWFSDHLCWTGVNRRNLHDLMPLPYNDDTARHVASRVAEIQERVGRRMLIENLSSYVTYKDSVMEEWDFLDAVASEAGCGILLDINNIYVSAFNHEFDPSDYLDAMDPERIYQFHLAGHLDAGDYIVDTHDHPIIDPVWSLYEEALKRFGPVSTMIERDANIPPLDDVMAELEHARKLARPIIGARAA